MPCVTSKLRCLRCDYRLAGLRDARCPECGAAFDPRQRQPRSPWRGRLCWAGVSTLAVVTAFTAPALVVVGQHGFWSSTHLWAATQISVGVLPGWKKCVLAVAVLTAPLTKRCRVLILLPVATALALSWTGASQIDALVSIPGTGYGFAGKAPQLRVTPRPLRAKFVWESSAVVPASASGG